MLGREWSFVESNRGADEKEALRSELEAITAEREKLEERVAEADALARCLYLCPSTYPYTCLHACASQGPERHDR